MILTKSISRFARNTVTLLETVRMLKALEVDVFFEEQNIHTMSADGELMLHYIVAIASINEIDLNEIVIQKDRAASLKYHHETNLETFMLNRQR